MNGYLDSSDTFTTAANMVRSVVFGVKTTRGVFQMRRDMLVALVRLVEEKRLKPPVSKVFGWRYDKGASEALAWKEQVGKIVVRVGGEQGGRR